MYKLAVYRRFLSRNMRHAEPRMAGGSSLHRLPDHLLKDIGLSRSEVLSVARFGWSDPTRKQRA
jgi:uncharacterized protein YjiS (DUF1127 family)